MLPGREREGAVLNGLLDRVRGGHSAAIVVHGEAGVGKTALLNEAFESAPGLRVVRAAGIESEMELPFAGGTRWRCSNCRGGCRPPSWPAASGCRTTCR